MVDGFLVVFPQGKIKQASSIEEAINFVEVFNKNNVEDYCKEYDIEYDDIKEDEAEFAGGYESGTVKVYNADDVIKKIKETEMLEVEKKSLLNIIEHTYRNINMEDYEDLIDVIEECNDISIEV